MRVVKSVLMLSLLLVPASALAQGTSQVSTDTATVVAAPAADTADQAPAARPASSPASSTMSARTISPRLQGGLLINNSQAGFVFGGGVDAKTFHNDMWEVMGDLNLIRINGSNSWMGSGNIQYDFTPMTSSARPYAGGGLAIVHNTGNPGVTNTRPQLLGGVEIPMKGHSPSNFLGEVRIIFTPSHVTTVFLAGISF